MRGGFVACVGGDAALEPDLDRAAAAFRFHRGTAAMFTGHGLRVAALVDEDGPDVATTARSTIVVHGRSAAPIEELQLQDGRFAAMESDGEVVRASRDAFGLAPLFFRKHRDAVWFATEAAPLIALGDCHPDRLALIRRIAFHPSDVETGWSGLARVLPGATIEVRADGSVADFGAWEPRASFGTWSGGWDDGVAAFRARFEESVARCRAPTFGLLLSGGLDSGAVGVTARRSASARFVHVRFPHLPRTDETQYARAVADAAGVPLDLPLGPVGPWDPAEDVRTSGGIAYDSLPFGIQETALAHLAGEGIAVALDGHDGDGIVGHGGGEWGALVARRQLRAVRAAFARHGAARAARAATSELAPWLPRLLRGRRTPGTLLQRVEGYFEEPLRSSLRANDHRRDHGFPRWRNHQLQPFLPQATVNMEQKEMAAARFGIDMRHPFADRRLAELALSLRLPSRIDPFRPKRLLLEALADLYPTALLERHTKSDYMEVVRHRVPPDRCLATIRDSAVRLPLFHYDRFFRDIEEGVEVPAFLLVQLTRAHVLAAG